MDTTLLDRFVSGEYSCFNQLFKRYYKSLYGYGLKLCNNPALVEDCIQDLFESLWGRRHDLSHITSPNVYLYVSLRRKILKARNKFETMEIVDIQQENLGISYGADELIIRDESKIQQKEKLKEALNHLSNQQKEVLYLYFYNGMSYGEIEKILSIHRQSVRNHMYRAMETLRTILKNDKVILGILPMISVLISLLVVVKCSIL